MMTKVKYNLIEMELLRVLRDGSPDASFYINDEEWTAELVDAYLWETLSFRVRVQSDISCSVTNLVKKGLLRFVTRRPSWFQRLLGRRSASYGYLTQLGREAVAFPATYIGVPLQRDDFDHRYEPKGMWLRQIEGMSPRSD